MGRVSISVESVGRIAPGRAMFNEPISISCNMSKVQIKSAIKSMLHHITDAEWSDIIEELAPDLLDELVEEKIQQSRG